MNKKPNKKSKLPQFVISILIGLFAFSAMASVPSVQTNFVGSVSGSCAELQGYSLLNSSGFSRWFEIKEFDKNIKPTTVNYNRQSSWYSGSFGRSATTNISGTFTAEVRNLIPDTDYVYRAVSQNTDGIVYGQEVFFRTKSAQYQTDAFTDCSDYIPMTTRVSAVTANNDNIYTDNYGNQEYNASYYSVPVSSVVSKEIKTKTLSSEKEQKDTTTFSNKNSEKEKSLAIAILADKSYSIFPKTLTDWFTIIFLTFVSVPAYLFWKYSTKKKEDESAREIPDILAINIEDIPKKPILEVVMQNEEKILELVMNTSKGAPPDNLPV